MLRNFLNMIKPAKSKTLEAKNQFLLYELAKMNEKIRQNELKEYHSDSQQTLDSFNYQWEHLSSGDNLPSDPKFLSTLQPQICGMTGLKPEWFQGKRVIDIGCGLGRFTYGLLSLGAHVTSCDASTAALKRVVALCEPYQNRLKTFQTNLINDQLPKEEFDLAFCFGVVHHTGNTYLATKKVCNAAKIGGKVFLMVYGYPKKLDDFVELNSYEALRAELRPLNFEKKVDLLKSKFPANQVHGWFDAVSPKINDLLTYEELSEILNSFNVRNLIRTSTNRNLHVIGDKLASISE